MKLTTGQHIVFDHKGDLMSGEIVGFTQEHCGGRVYHIKVMENGHMLMYHNVTPNQIKQIKGENNAN